MNVTKPLSFVAGTAGLLFALSSAAQGPFPTSDQYYVGASSSRPFIAIPGDQQLINGSAIELNVLGQKRSYDYGGDIPFKNIYTNAPDPYILQGWKTLPLPGQYVNLDYKTITNAGLEDHIYKQGDTLVIKTVYGDGLVNSNPLASAKSFLISYPIPPRTHVRWEMDVAFGDAENEWKLLIPNTKQVGFWEIKSDALRKPSLSADVDTDPTNPEKLAITFYRAAPMFDSSGNDVSERVALKTVYGIERHTNVNIVVEAFLDERTTSEGKGRVRFTVNGTLAGDFDGPTLVPYNKNKPPASHVHLIQIGSYPFSEQSSPIQLTRATFWKTARLFVYPLGQ